MSNLTPSLPKAPDTSGAGNKSLYLGRRNYLVLSESLIPKQNPGITDFSIPDLGRIQSRDCNHQSAPLTNWISMPAVLITAWPTVMPNLPEMASKQMHWQKPASRVWRGLSSSSDVRSMWVELWRSVGSIVRRCEEMPGWCNERRALTRLGSTSLQCSNDTASAVTGFDSAKTPVDFSDIAGVRLNMPGSGEALQLCGTWFASDSGR